MYSSIGRKPKQCLRAAGVGGLDKKKGNYLAFVHTKQAFSLSANELGAWKVFVVCVTLEPINAQMWGVCEKKNRQLKPKERLLLFLSYACGWCPCLLWWRAAEDCFASVLPTYTYPPTLFHKDHDPHLGRSFMNSPMALSHGTTRTGHGEGSGGSGY